jgi:hypothetical protein
MIMDETHAWILEYGGWTLVADLKTSKNFGYDRDSLSDWE